MRKTFYGITSNKIFSSQIRIDKNIKKEHIPLKVTKNKNISFNKENLEFPNDSNDKSYKMINKNILNKDSNEDKSYIFYGNNKLFKPKNKNFSAYNITSKYKKMNNGQILENNNYSNNSNSSYKFKEFTNLPRQLSDDLILNISRNNNPKFNSNFSLNNYFFPDINRLNKKRNENDLNINYFFNNGNSQKSQIEQLNQLHKNFINSFKNICGKSDDIDKINNLHLFNENKNKNTIIRIKKNNLLESNKYNKRWLNDNIIDKKLKIHKSNNKKDEEKKFSKNNTININSYYNDIEKIKLNKDKVKYLRKINNYQLLKQNNIKVNNNIKKSEIKINIEKYLKDRKKTIDTKESKNNSIFSINFSNNLENIDNNKSDSEQSNKYNNKNELKININQKIPQFKSISHKNIIISSISSYIKDRDKNFSFLSSKNMKIEENLGVDADKNNKNIKKNENMINDNDKKEKEIKEEENSNVKFNFKTTTNFFSSKFKNKQNYKEDNLNIKNIINNVLENNKRASNARDSTSFYKIENFFINNKMRKSQNNFYSSSYYKKDTNFTKEQTKETNSNSNKKFNQIQLTLISPKEWEKHEEIWMNIKNINEKFEKYVLPPNDMDALVSCYLKMYPYKLNICNLSKVNSFSKNQKEILSFYIDDDIENPRNEIKKWKNAYKKMILRWHPDKLFPLINELNLKNEFIKKELERRSSLIVNNINALYQNINEILKKILINKENLECNNK